MGVDLVPWRLDHPRSGFGLAQPLSTLGTRFGNGFDDFYGTHLPFDPRVHASMHELVLSALFLFALGVALLVAARKPVPAALTLLAGAGWPATLLGPSHGVAMGAAILGAALLVLAGLGSRRCGDRPVCATPLSARRVPREKQNYFQISSREALTLKGATRRRRRTNARHRRANLV